MRTITTNFLPSSVCIQGLRFILGRSIGSWNALNVCVFSFRLGPPCSTVARCFWAIGMLLVLFVVSHKGVNRRE